MANEENLIPFNKLTEREQREIAQKGGKKSVEARRKKKLFKECMENLLQMPVSDKRIYKKLENMGIPPEDIDNRCRLTVALFEKAALGDVTAFKEVMNLSEDDSGEYERQENSHNAFIDAIRERNENKSVK